MSVNQMYATWFAVLVQLLPHERQTRLRNLSWVLTGMACRASVKLNSLATVFPRTGHFLSALRRVERFFSNAAFTVRLWYQPVVTQMLALRPKYVPLHLIIDSTRIGLHYQWLVVALAYRHRALPLAWEWLDYAKGHSPAAVQIRVLAYVRSLLPPGQPVILVGDSEFGSVAVLTALDAWGWQYVLRQKGRTLVRARPDQPWHCLRDLAAQQRHLCHWAHWSLSRRDGYVTHLVTVWRRGYKQPWLLATNLEDARTACAVYRQRMWIEGLFGDLKGKGMHFAATQLRDVEKLSRLALAVTLVYLSCIVFGIQLRRQRNGNRVESRRRRRLSIFQIGWRWLQLTGRATQRLRWSLNPFRPKLSGN